MKRIALISTVSNHFNRTGYWASDEQRRGSGTFYPICFHSLRLSAVPLKVLGDGEDLVSATFKVDAEDHASVPLIVKPGSDQKSKNKVSRRIDAYCLSYLDRFIRVVSVGDRNQSVSPVELVTGQKTFFVSKQGQSTRAALANRLRAPAGSGVVMKLLRSENKTVRSLGQAGT